MGFFSWLLCSILVVALVLLLFPFSVRIEFEAGERGARALFFFFKKKVYEYEKKWGLGGDDKCVDRESRPSSLGQDRDQHLGQERSDCPKTRDEREVGSRKDDVGCEKRDSSDVILSETEDTPEKRESRPSLLGHDRAQGGGAEPHPVKSNAGSESAPLTEAVAKKPADSPKTECLEMRDERRKTKDEREVGSRKSEVGISESEKRESQPASSSTVREGNHNVSDCTCEKDPVKSSDDSENAQPAKVKASSVVEVKESKHHDDEKSETPADDSKKKSKKEKRKLSDREFWTILLTPDLDARAFRYVLKILGAVFSLFRIRFKDCFIEGIQADYQTMGYLAATNGVLKAFPYVGDWDLRMDWTREKELRAAGTVRLSVTLLRVFCFILETLVLAGILAFSFWRRRARVIKTNELPELGFVRKKILNIILED